MTNFAQGVQKLLFQVSAAVCWRPFEFIRIVYLLGRLYFHWWEQLVLFGTASALKNLVGKVGR